MSLTSAWPSTTHTFKERSGQEGVPKGGKRTKGPWLTIPSWKVDGRQSLGNSIESTAFAVSAAASYWFYSHWNLKPSCFLYPWLLRCFLLPTTLHLLRLQTSANSHSTEPRGWGGNQRRGCSLLLVGEERWAARRRTGSRFFVPLTSSGLSGLRFWLWKFISEDFDNCSINVF